MSKKSEKSFVLDKKTKAAVKKVVQERIQRVINSSEYRTSDQIKALDETVIKQIVGLTSHEQIHQSQYILHELEKATQRIENITSNQFKELKEYFDIKFNKIQNGLPDSFHETTKSREEAINQELSVEDLIKNTTERLNKDTKEETLKLVKSLNNYGLDPAVLDINNEFQSNQKHTNEKIEISVEELKFLEETQSQIKEFCKNQHSKRVIPRTIQSSRSFEVKPNIENKHIGSSFDEWMKNNIPEYPVIVGVFNKAVSELRGKLNESLGKKINFHKDNTSVEENQCFVARRTLLKELGVKIPEQPVNQQMSSFTEVKKSLLKPKLFGVGSYGRFNLFEENQMVSADDVIKRFFNDYLIILASSHDEFNHTDINYDSTIASLQQHYLEELVNVSKLRRDDALIILSEVMCSVREGNLKEPLSFAELKKRVGVVDTPKQYSIIPEGGIKANQTLVMSSNTPRERGLFVEVKPTKLFSKTVKDVVIFDATKHKFNQKLRLDAKTVNAFEEFVSKVNGGLPVFGENRSDLIAEINNLPVYETLERAARVNLNNPAYLIRFKNAKYDGQYKITANVTFKDEKVFKEYENGNLEFLIRSTQVNQHDDQARNSFSISKIITFDYNVKL